MLFYVLTASVVYGQPPQKSYEGFAAPDVDTVPTDAWIPMAGALSEVWVISGPGAPFELRSTGTWTEGAAIHVALPPDGAWIAGEVYELQAFSRKNYLDMDFYQPPLQATMGFVVGPNPARPAAALTVVSAELGEWHDDLYEEWLRSAWIEVDVGDAESVSMVTVTDSVRPWVNFVDVNAIGPGIHILHARQTRSSETDIGTPSCFEVVAWSASGERGSSEQVCVGPQWATATASEPSCGCGTSTVLHPLFPARRR